MVAIIGTGRVGLPLALSLAEHGHEVIGIDIDNDLVTKANMGEMPFMEKGCNGLISKKKVKFESEYSALKDVSDIIITVGTPLMQHVETDLEYIKSVIKSIIPFLKKDDNIILRSTVAPNTTQFLRKTIEKETIELLN
jgi:UDP-N-acetyl-D-mannosaminuronic acid dehydrogenase